MRINLTELDTFVINRYCNGLPSAIQIMRAINRITFGNNQCYIRSEKLESMAGISKSSRQRALNRLEDINYIRVTPRSINGIQLPNLIERMPISEKILQEYADAHFIPGIDNDWHIRIDGRLAHGWHPTMVGPDVPDTITGNPTEVDRGYLNKDKSPQPNSDDSRPVFGGDGEEVPVEEIMTNQRDPVQPRDEGGVSTEPTPQSGVTTKKYKLKQEQRKYSGRTSEQVLGSTRKEKKVSSDSASPRRESSGFVNARQSRAETKDSDGEKLEKPKKSDQKRSDFSKTNKSENTKKDQKPKNPTSYTQKIPKKSFKNSVKVNRELSYKEEDREKYLLSQICDYDERHEGYAELSEKEGFKKYREIIELQCYLYQIAKSSGLYAKQVKPLPAYAPKMNRLKQQVSMMGGVDVAKKYFGWLIENGGDEWLARYGWRHYSIFSLYCQDAVADFLMEVDGVEVEDVRMGSGSMSSDERRAVKKGEWTEPDYDPEKYGVERI